MARATSRLVQPPGLMSRSHHSAVSRVTSASLPRPPFVRAGPVTGLTPKTTLAVRGSRRQPAASAGDMTAVRKTPSVSW